MSAEKPAATDGDGDRAPTTASSGSAATTRLLDLDFSNLDTAQTAAFLASRDESSPFGFVVTPNAQHLVELARHPELSSTYHRALLCVLDSRVVAKAAGLLRLPRPSVVPGSDLVAELLTEHLRPGDRITIVGVWPEHLPLLEARFADATFARIFPPMGFEHDPAAFAEVVEFVIAHPARFILLACGMPRQELVADALLASGRVGGTALCIGSGLEFLIGAQRRAPRWMQRAGLEWLFRLTQDPRRLARRYLVESPGVFRLLLRERRTRRRREP